MEKILQRIDHAQHTKAGMFLHLPSIKPELVLGGYPLSKYLPTYPRIPKQQNNGALAITGPLEVKQLIMDQQKIQFGQATPTPFSNEPLKSTFNWTGTSPEVEVTFVGYYYVPLFTVELQSNQILHRYLACQNGPGLKQ